MGSIDTNSRPTAMKMEYILIEEDEPFVFHLFGNQPSFDAFHFIRSKSPIKGNDCVFCWERFSFPVHRFCYFHFFFCLTSSFSGEAKPVRWKLLLGTTFHGTQGERYTSNSSNSRCSSKGTPFCPT